MPLRRPGRSGRWRVAVFIAVVGLHVVVGLLLVSKGTVRFARLRADTPLSIVRLSLEIPLRLPVRPPASELSQPPRRRDSLREVDRLVAEPEPGNAITLPLDLRAEGEAAARRQADKKEDERRWRNLAGPSESQLEWWRNNAPLAPDHPYGDSEHAEGGEIITWVDDKCYWTTHGIATFGPPQSSKVCKDPPKPETELFKDMRKKLDEGAKAQ
jgi:hypothetical protein